MPDFESLLGDLPDAVIVTSQFGEVRWANRAAEELLDDRLDHWVGRNMLDAVHPDDQVIAMNACMTVGEKELGGLLAVRIRRSTGELLAVELRGRMVEWESEQAIALVVRRVDDRGEFELAGNELTVLHRLVHHSPAILAMVDDDLKLLSVNAAITRSLGLDPAVICGRPLLDLIEPSDRPVVERLMEDLDGGIGECPVAMFTSIGERRLFGLRATDLRAEKAVGAIAVSMSDVTDLRLAEEELRRHADIDPLTGVLNRRALELRVAGWPGGPRSSIGVLFVDLDAFKSINDIHGHQVGDDVLVEMGRRLTKLCPTEGAVARVGGDEFVVALPVRPDERSSLVEIGRQASERFEVEGIAVSASAGVAMTSLPCDLDGLIAVADDAMYGVKRERRRRAGLLVERPAVVGAALSGA